MKHIKQYNKYKVNEALGVIESTLYYVEVIKSNLLNEILDFIDSDPEIGKKVNIEVTIPFSSIKRYVTDWKIYPDFPVSEILVDLSMIKKRQEDIKKLDFDTREESPTPIKMGGFASSFARGRERAATRFKEPVKMNVDHSLLVHMGVSFEFSDLFNKRRHDVLLETKLESVILHELNHVYEYYQRKLKNKSNIALATTWASIGPNKMKRPKVIWEYWQNNFTDFIYQSEPHELRAYVQEAKAYVDRMDLASFKRTNVWKTANHMANFNAEKFKKRFNEFIKEYNPEYVDKIIDMLVKDFIKEYTELAEDFKETPRINPDTLYYMSTDDFLDFWGRKIRQAGDVLVRRMLRLYSYKMQKEEEF